MNDHRIVSAAGFNAIATQAGLDAHIDANSANMDEYRRHKGWYGGLEATLYGIGYDAGRAAAYGSIDTSIPIRAAEAAIVTHLRTEREPLADGLAEHDHLPMPDQPDPTRCEACGDVLRAGEVRLCRECGIVADIDAGEQEVVP